MGIATHLYWQALRVVGYNNERQTIEIGFLNNESQTMMTFVSKDQSQSLIILGWYLPFHSNNCNMLTLNSYCSNTSIIFLKQK